MDKGDVDEYLDVKVHTEDRKAQIMTYLHFKSKYSIEI